MKVLGFVNFDLGGYLLQNGIAGLKIKAEKYFDYSWIGNWTGFKIIYWFFFSRFNLKHREWQTNACTRIYFEQYRKQKNLAQTFRCYPLQLMLFLFCFLSLCLSVHVVFWWRLFRNVKPNTFSLLFFYLSIYYIKINRLYKYHHKFPLIVLSQQSNAPVILVNIPYKIMLTGILCLISISIPLNQQDRK